MRSSIRASNYSSSLDEVWGRIIEFAEACGVTTTEFVRSATLFVMDQGDSPMVGLTEFIKQAFRISYITATILRDEMLEAGNQERLEELVEEVRGLQARLLREGKN